MLSNGDLFATVYVFVLYFFNLNIFAVINLQEDFAGKLYVLRLDVY